MPLLEKKIQTSFLARSLFRATLSAPLLSDGFTGGGRDGRGEGNRRRTLHSQVKPLPQKKKTQLLLVPLFTMTGSIFPPLFKKKRGLQQWKIRVSHPPLRALGRLNQCRRQLEAEGDELQGASPQSLSG